MQTLCVFPINNLTSICIGKNFANGNLLRKVSYGRFQICQRIIPKHEKHVCHTNTRVKPKAKILFKSISEGRLRMATVSRIHKRRNSEMRLLSLLSEISLRFHKDHHSQLKYLNKANLYSCSGGWTRKNEHRHTEAGSIEVFTLTQVVTGSFHHCLKSDFSLPRLDSFKRIRQDKWTWKGVMTLAWECGEGLCAFIGLGY